MSWLFILIEILKCFAAMKYIHLCESFFPPRVQYGCSENILRERYYFSTVQKINRINLLSFEILKIELFERD